MCKTWCLFHSVTRLVSVFHCEADVWTSLGNAWRNREAGGGGGVGALTGSGNWSHYGHHVAPQSSRAAVARRVSGSVRRIVGFEEAKRCDQCGAECVFRLLLVLIHSEICVPLQRLAVGGGLLRERWTSEAAFLERKVTPLTSYTL